MPYLIICGAALVVAALTLLSGFGLGTLLLPAFMIYFPANIAVASTAVVHLLNNIFKFFLVGKHADWNVVVRFALPAGICSIFGALLLTKLSRIPFHYEYMLFGNNMDITPVKAIIAVLMLFFGLVEMVSLDRSRYSTIFTQRYISAGGAISGFFGGISGHQGALRAAFLIRTGLDKESFIGTSVICAIVVDITRITVYGFAFFSQLANLGEIEESNSLSVLVAATAAAFLGSFAGSRLMKKVTVRTVHLIVGTLLLVFAVLLGFGFI